MMACRKSNVLRLWTGTAKDVVIDQALSSDCCASQGFGGNDRRMCREPELLFRKVELDERMSGIAFAPCRDRV